MMGADAMKFTSRILEGLVVCRGLVEPRIGVCCGTSRYKRYFDAVRFEDVEDKRKPLAALPNTGCDCGI